MLKTFLSSFQILDKSSKIKFCIIIFFATIATILEIFSLSSLYNLINNLLDITSVNDNILISGLNKILFFFNLSPNIEHIIYFILIIFFIKFVFFIFLYFYQYSFINYLRANLSSQLLKKYLNKDYIYHVDQGATKLMRNTDTEVAQFVIGVITSMLVIFTEIIIIFGILYLLFVVNPFVLISAILVLVLISSLYILFTKNYLLRLGHIRQDNSNSSLKALIESLQGIKNTKIFQVEKFFIKTYFEKLKKIARSNFLLSLFNSIPKLGLELLIIFFGSSIIIYFNYSKNLNLEVISSISLFALAAFKILPSITKFIVAIQNIRFNKPSIDVISRELKQTEILETKQKTGNQYLDFNKEIKFSNMSFRYPNSNSDVLNSVNLKIKKFEKIGIYGKSGSGKTTFVDLLIGLFNPTNGCIFIDNKELNNITRSSWINKVGYVPQKIYLIDDSIKKNIAFGFNENKVNDRQVVDAAKKSNSLEFIEKLSEGFETRIGENGAKVSGGQAQRIAIARCFYKNADLIIFDEPTSALDEISENEIMSTISKLNSTVVIISHNKELLQFCDKIYELKDKNLNLIK